MALTTLQSQGTKQFYKSSGDCVIQDIDANFALCLLEDGTNPLTADWDAGAKKITSAEFSTDTISEETSDAGVTIDGITLKDGGALDITGGTNTFNLTNGTASLDIAAGATLNIDKGLQVTTNAGTLAFSAASKTLTVEDNSIVNQDLTSDASPTFGGLALGAGNLTMTGSIAATGSRVTKLWATAVEITSAAGLTIGGSQINSDALSDVASIAMIDEAEAITGDWTFDGNHPIEGYSTGRNVLRSITVKIEPGATPNTNIDVTLLAVAYGSFNAPSITDADDLAKNASSGSWALNAIGTGLTLDITETIVAPLSTSILSGKWNTAEEVPYYIYPIVVSGNLIFYIRKVGVDTGTGSDWTTILDANDEIILQVSFVTST